MKRDYLVEEACELAARTHAHHFLSGTDIPYIAHPMAVGIILAEAGATTEAIIAGILHDAVEESQLNLVEIEKLFGSLVLSFLETYSETDKSLSWEEGKRKTLIKLQGADRDTWLIVLADNLNKIRSMARYYELDGENIWKRMQQGRQEQEWYYRGLVEALRQNYRFRPCMFFEFEKLVKQLFD
ncbi:MAG: HD domain-containing protein [Syntrophomonadaceae bacterium]|jgi:(p)ppGpp synthase/HD superfamily hydrolase|nr:HD domain-containing protein [Syntrophomonadaceae bacterium]